MASHRLPSSDSRKARRTRPEAKATLPSYGGRVNGFLPYSLMTRALGQGLGTRAGLTAPANRSSANRQRPTPAAGTSADASALPFGDAAFDLVVAYNSLMDVEDLPGSVWEAERVLGPGGHL